MRKLMSSVTLSAVLASTLLASSGDGTDVQQMRKELNDLKQMVLELKKSNNDFRSSVPAVAGTSANELAELKASVSDIKNSLEGNEKSGFQLAGYASFGWTDRQNANNDFSTVQFSPIFHYQYGDIFQFEGELEIFTTKDGATVVGLEYAAGNLYLNNNMVLMVGKFMSPIGQFIQNQHPSWINKMPSKPLGFDEEQAAPISNIGIALRGGLPKIGTMRSNYVVYVSNAPSYGLGEDGDLAIDTESTTTSNGASKTWGARFAINPVGGMEIGVSGATGEVAETLGTSGDVITRNYDVFGADMMYHTNYFDIKAEYVQQKVGDNSLSALTGGTWKAWYTQASHQFNSIHVETVARYSDYQSPITDVSQVAVGVNYLFANNVIAKLAYEFNRDNTNSVNSVADDNRILAQLAFGF